MTKLFTPLKVGRMELAHRISMAPLTRFRADDDHVPLPFVKEYYSQRTLVPGTFVITEATLIAARAGSYPNVPGIYTPQQIAAWREITDVVHRQGSYIYLQLWALGRVANPELLKKETGGDVISSSPTPLNADSTVPRELTESEIQEFIGYFAQAAKNAVEQAGFDGVEIHGANGYLIDQFNQDVVNKRTDRWGGSVENRGRFAIEVTKAVVEAVGADRTAIRLSPFNTYQGMRMKDPVPQFSYLAKELAKLKLAYVHVVEPRVAGNTDIETSDTLDFFFEAYGNASPVVLAGGYTAKHAFNSVDNIYKDHDVVVAFGRFYISNPDLPFRVKEGIDFTPYVRDTFYLPKETRGYTDYPFSEKFVPQAEVVKSKA